MDCARNIITANFSGGGTSATTAPLWQWDYGQVLCITGIDLPAAFEVHFSTNRTGGVSTVAVGADGQVTIPSVLLTIGKNINAWIYLSDSEGEGETEYSILIPVKARPMPETYDAEVTGEFDDVVRQVSEYAETAQTAADNAGASATAAAASADSAAASASAAETAKTAAQTAQGKAEDAQAAAETAAQTAIEKAQQTAQDAAQAAQSKANAESAAGMAEAAQTGAESAKTDAETAAQDAVASALAASASATSAGQAASAAAQSATAAAQSAASIEDDVQTASQKAAEAQTAAGQAVTAKDAAVTAQQGAETAETNAGQSASTATAKASEAAQSATSAALSKTDAEAAATRAEQAAASLTVDSALSDTSVNPVQNKVITGELTNVKSAIDALDSGKIALYPDTSAWYRGYFTSAGVFSATTTNAAPTNEPFLVTSGHTIDIYPNGLSVTLRKFSKSGNTYTHIASNVYTTDTSVAFDADTYVSIHVNKTSGATLTLAEVTTKLWITSNIQYQIDGLEADINDVETSTTAQITAVDAKATDGINRLSAFLFEDGDAVTIQKDTAETFSLNTPKGYIHVKSTNEKIYTGTINFIDLFGLAQGVFTDSHSGIVIEISGNEIYIHGNASAGFRFNPQTGDFFTDSLQNHPSDFSNLPNNHVIYRLCWYEADGYSLPTSIYFGAKDESGNAGATNLQGRSRAFYRDIPRQYLLLYSNTTLSNVDIKFTIGLKISAMPGSFASIEAVAKTPYGTTIITGAGYYECSELTWTGASNTYDVVQTNFNAEADPLTNGHVYAWFGDSLSQLKELPNIVADLLNVNVYDCTFAGAPLTYGDPTKYQPTGFMSLCSQIVAGDFTPLSDALDAQEAAGTSVTEKRQHLATLEALDFSTVTDIVLLAGTNDFDNDYVNATNFVSGFSGALTTLLTAYPHLMVYVISPPWRGDKTEGVTTIPTMEDIVELEKGVADDFCLPWYDLYHRSGINALTATVYLTNDLLHPSDAGDALLANKCAKFIQSN
jgi:hypothetical protein